jgi:hypothetical protein
MYGKLLLTGLDWLTMTWPHKATNREKAAGAVFERLGELEIGGWEIKDRKAMQFVGVGTDKLQWLRSDSHSMLRASGYEATETARRIIIATCAGNCTRLDAQVTADYEERDPDFAHKFRQQLGARYLGDEARNRKKSTHFEDSNGDTGLTFGSRNSESYLRIYHAASGGHPELPDTAIRFEYEFKAERAKQVWGMVERAASVEVCAASVVTGQLLAAGIKESWFGDEIPEQLPALADFRNIAKTLRWYETQVVPSLRRHVTGEHQETIRRLFLDALYPRELVVKRRTELKVPQLAEIYTKEHQNA